MTKPNKSNILTIIDRINQNLKKVEKIIYMFLKSRKLFLPCNPRVKDLVLFDGDIYIYIYMRQYVKHSGMNSIKIFLSR
jgi:hypothetical protein